MQEVTASRQAMAPHLLQHMTTVPCKRRYVTLQKKQGVFKACAAAPSKLQTCHDMRFWMTRVCVCGWCWIHCILTRATAGGVSAVVDMYDSGTGRWSTLDQSFDTMNCTSVMYCVVCDT